MKLLAVALVVAVVAVIATKTVGHHTTCRDVIVRNPPFAPENKSLCTRHTGLW